MAPAGAAPPEHVGSGHKPGVQRDLDSNLSYASTWWHDFRIINSGVPVSLILERMVPTHPCSLLGRVLIKGSISLPCNWPWGLCWVTATYRYTDLQARAAASEATGQVRQGRGGSGALPGNSNPIHASHWPHSYPSGPAVPAFGCGAPLPVGKV